MRRFRAKKLGVAGVILMGAHILLHVVECLIVPTALVALGGHAVEEQAVAADGTFALPQVIDEEDSVTALSAKYLIDFEQSLSGELRLNSFYEK